jgi:hypothetical protein
MPLVRLYVDNVLTHSQPRDVSSRPAARTVAATSAVYEEVTARMIGEWHMPTT